MYSRPVTSPVVLMIFNRPAATARVFAEIARARPRTLLIVADGPRPDRPGESEKCADARAVIDRLDWDCQVLTNFADANLGCRQRIASGLEWVFETVDEAIILEDDCLPEPTFFRFCDELLERYREDERIGMISGDNFQMRPRSYPACYYFSRYTHIWGWATWRRAWTGYDPEIKLWPDVRASRLLSAVFADPAAIASWQRRLDAVHSGAVDTWDYQWQLHCWTQNRLAILPSVNLVSNLGFGADATHTTTDSVLANLPTQPMPFPLRHPPFMQRDVAADDFTERTYFSPPSIFRRISSRLGWQRAGRRQ